MMEAYLAVRAGAAGYTPQGKPLAWVFTIVRNAVGMQRRKLSRETWLEDISPAALAVQENTDARLSLELALRELGEEEREIVLLHAASGLKHREIASALSLPLSTVLSKYTRALKKLRRIMIEAGEEAYAKTE